MIEHIITGMVLHRPLTGYDIKKEIAIGIGHFYQSSNGNLYPSLKKLTDSGHLVLTEQTQVARLKKYYMATEAGKAAFFAWLTAPFEIGWKAPTILSKVYFFGELPPDVRRQKLQEYEMYMQKMIDGYREMERTNLAEFIDNGNIVDYYGVSTLYYGLQNVSGMLRWLRHIEAEKPLGVFMEDDM